MNPSTKTSRNVYFVTYGAGPFEHRRKKILKQAQKFNRFYECYAFGREDIDVAFLEKTSPYIHAKRGGGYWLWKPHFVFRVLSQMQEGDFLVYADAGCTFKPKRKQRFDQMLEWCDVSKHGMGIFSLGTIHREYEWTKREIFDHFGVALTDDIALHGQILATIFLIKKNQYSMDLIRQWVDLAENHTDLFGDELTPPQHPKFIDNRHDQSIFSMLCKLAGVVPIPPLPPPINARLKNPIKHTRIRDDQFSYKFKRRMKSICSIILNKKR